MDEIVIVSAVRTPIGKFGGLLKDQTARMLGTHVVKEAIKRANLEPTDIDEGIFGQVLQAGTGQNIARQILVDSGVPFSIPAMTINEVCGSGLKADILGNQQIQLNQAVEVVVGVYDIIIKSHSFDRTLCWEYYIDDSIFQ